MQSLSGNNTTASYTYDEQGVRSSKTVNGVTTTFSYNGSLLMAQVQGSGTSQVKQLFSYDANGDVVSVNYNGIEYFYLRNGQNDVVGLMDGSGNRVVEYTYDAWGKLISTTGTLATSLGADNPFRYRGYYYDTETGLYYLMTRYYDPEVCRFISADVYMTTGQGIAGGNMYAYCGNNPVCRYDDGGEFWHLVIGAAVGAAISFVSSVVTDLVAGEEVNWKLAGISAASGAVSGLLAATGVGLAGQVVGNAVISGVTNVITQIATKPANKFSWSELGTEIAAGAVSGLVGGKGASYVPKASTITNVTFKTTVKTLGSKPTVRKATKAVVKSLPKAARVVLGKSVLVGAVRLMAK